MELKIANEEDSGLWDEIVETSSYGTIFHIWKFLKIMEKHTVKKSIFGRSKAVLYPIIAFKGSNPIGIFPVYLYGDGFIKLALSPPTRVECLYLGPLLLSYDLMKQSKRESTLLKFQKEMDRFIFSEIKPNYLSFHISPGILDSRPFKWTGYSVKPRHTYLIDLSHGIDDIWKGFQRELRKKIDKAIRGGVVVKEGSKKELGYIYESLSKRRHEQGMGMTSPPEYIKEIYCSFRDKINILVAKKGEQYLGGIVNLSYKDKVASWIGTAKSSNGFNSNELLLWESIKLAQKKDFRYYEIMDADPQSLYHFKKQYTGDLITCLSCDKYSPESIKLLEVLYRTIKSSYKIS